MAIHSGILAWRIPWTEEPEGYTESDRTERLTLSFFSLQINNKQRLQGTGAYIMYNFLFLQINTQERNC